MNELKIFESQEFGQVRTMTDENNEPWFVGKDVAEILGYSNTRDAMSKHVDPDDKGVANCDTPSGEQKMTIINESGLYSLILSSKMPRAKEFKRWVTTEVLPSIRKTGGYIKGQEQMTDAELLSSALLVAQKTIEERTARLTAAEEKIERDAPKVLFADAVSASKTSILIGELAKILRQNGVDIGQNRLFEYLRNQGYLCKAKGALYNCPTQRSMEMRLFQVVEGTHLNSDGVSITTRTTKVTGKGQQYFISKFIQKKEAAES